MRVGVIIDQLAAKLSPCEASERENMFVEITKVYHEMYAGALSGLFETSWFYFTEDGKMTFPRQDRVLDVMATFLKLLSSTALSNGDEGARLEGPEVRVVWELALIANHGPQPERNARPSALPSWTDPVEARSRVLVVETLLGGENLSSNPLTPPYHDKDTARVRQFDFWYTLAELIRWRGDRHDPKNTKLRQDCLARMRSLLDGRENRDVLYSIAVVREMTPTYGLFDERTVPPQLNETDPRSRFNVANRFIINQTRADGGGTNVVRRLCQIAECAYIRPGICAQVRA